MGNSNRQWKLARYPRGMPKVEDWTLEEGPVPEPGPGQVLLASRFLDVAPYMRGRISPQRNYAAGVAPGDVMIGGAVAEVVRSEVEGYAPGDLVVSDFDFGWQDYAVLEPAKLRRVDPTVAPPECWLDVLGLNGITAYFGLFAAAGMRAGDTVAVSAASGSVGQLVGQLTQIAGGRAIAIASTAEKIAACRELGFDDGVAYRENDDLASALKAICPGGIDVYFDNTVGPILDAVLQNLATHARITICGTVSLAGRFGEPDTGERFWRQVLVARARIQGFLVLDYRDRYEEARTRLARWVREGRIRQRFDIAEGLERTPDAFIRLLTSRTAGKQLVRNS
jgi:NADPH-dependent curcumin reductase CurA